MGCEVYLSIEYRAVNAEGNKTIFKFCHVGLRSPTCTGGTVSRQLTDRLTLLFCSIGSVFESYISFPAYSEIVPFMKNSSQKIIPPEVLLEAYSNGIFPMSEARDDETVGWYSAKARGIIPMEKFKVSSNVERLIRQGRYTCRFNTSFRQVVTECANRESTWISDLIINSFEMLHLAGHAHSVEIFDEEEHLAGGLYGVSLG